MTNCMYQPSEVLCTLSLAKEVFQTVYELKAEHQFKVESSEQDEESGANLWVEFHATGENTVQMRISKGPAADKLDELENHHHLPPETCKIECSDLLPDDEEAIDKNYISDAVNRVVDDEEQAHHTGLLPKYGAIKKEEVDGDESLHCWSTDTELAGDSDIESEAVSEAEQDDASRKKRPKYVPRKKTKPLDKNLSGKPAPLPKRKYKITKLRGHYTCDRCPFETGFKKALAQHTKEEHRGEKGLRNRERDLTCEFCSVKVTDTYGLLRHIKRKHQSLPSYDDVVSKIDKERSFPCTYPGCDITFVRQANVERHILDVHLYDGQAVVCDICQKQVKSEQCLKVHKKIVHEVLHKDFLCFLCGTSYKAKGQLDDHIRNVHDTRKYPCEQCEFMGKSPKTLKRHAQRKHGPALYMCAFCAKKFKTRNNLDVHVMTIHQSGEIQQHQCPECPRKFNLKCNLKKHVDGVHKKIFLKCNYCSKRFMKAEFKESHIRMKHPQMINPELQPPLPLEAVEVIPTAGNYCLL